MSIASHNCGIGYDSAPPDWMGEAEWRDLQAPMPTPEEAEREAKAWYEQRKKERLREAAKRWYYRHKNEEEYKKKHREYARKWTAKNREKYNEYQKEYKRKIRSKDVVAK